MVRYTLNTCLIGDSGFQVFQSAIECSAICNPQSERGEVLKLAITGKGGVGKTTLAATLALLFSKDDDRVIAIDADPDSNLAATLGFPEPEKIVPLVDMKELISERTEVQSGGFGSYFKLNPKVDDIPERYGPEYQGVRLLAMGGGRKGGSGCFCPESAFLRSLLAHLLIGREDVVILDMEAGIEHLTRGTAQGVDALIVVVEPGKRSVETAFRIKELASDLNIGNLFVVGNKVRDHSDADFIREHISDLDLLGLIAYDREMEDPIGETALEMVRPIKACLAEKLSPAG